MAGNLCGPDNSRRLWDFLKGKRATCYPDMESEIEDAYLTGAPVATDENIITSQGVGTAIDFALKLIEVLISPIVESCPSDNKEKAMSLLHSFYCWGHVQWFCFPRFSSGYLELKTGRSWH